MSGPEPSREDALRRLQERADALESQQAAKTPPDYGAHAASSAYRILAELLGGVAVGLAIGAGLDFVAGTRPWGIIGGVLMGFAVSIWMARRTANRLMALAAKGPPPTSVPFDDEED
jgi:ATP synthase protein I